MQHELIYTSVPKGLLHGSSGFCTVACTPEIPPNLEALLRQLSAYRHLAPPGSPSNPVVYSHLIARLGERDCHILSRVADAGFDYTHRTNKLAHHLALDAGSPLLPRTDPFALFLGEKFFLKEWNREPTLLSPDRPIPVGTLRARPARTWEALTGDAGHAGLLAAAFEAQRPVCLSASCETPFLTLFAEAASLLPADKRWQVTFCTFFTKYPPNVRCSWRAVVTGSAEESAARTVPHQLFLSIHRGGDRVEADNALTRWYVEFARIGSPPGPKPERVGAGQAFRPKSAPEAPPKPEEDAKEETAEVQGVEIIPLRLDELPKQRKLRQIPLQGLTPEARMLAAARRKKFWLLAVLGGGVVIAAALAAFFWYAYGHENAPAVIPPAKTTIKAREEGQ